MFLIFLSDGDGDLVSFSSDAEMLEFTRTAEDEFLRIFIKGKNQNLQE